MTAESSAKRGRGRPPGSKNKPKTLEQLLTRRHPEGADMETLMRSGADNEIATALRAGKVKLLDDGRYVWIVPAPLPSDIPQQFSDVEIRNMREDDIIDPLAKPELALTTIGLTAAARQAFQPWASAPEDRRASRILPVNARLIGMQARGRTDIARAPPGILKESSFPSADKNEPRCQRLLLTMLAQKISFHAAVQYAGRRSRKLTYSFNKGLQ
jgi:hypothetical protein